MGIIEKRYRFVESGDEKVKKEELKRLIDSLGDESIIYAEITTQVSK